MKQKKRKKGRILLAVGIFLAITDTVAVILTIMCLNLLETIMVVGVFLQGTLSTVSQRFSHELADYDALPWLLSYWEEHEDEMNLDPGQLRDKNSGLFQARENHLVMDVKNVTPEEVETYTEEEQKYFAEFCYIQLQEELRTYADAYLNVTSICFREGEEGEYVFFYDESHTTETEPALGLPVEFAPETKDRTKEAVETVVEGRIKASYTTVLNGNEVFCVLEPIIKENTGLCYVMCCLNAEDLDIMRTVASFFVTAPVILLLIVMGIVIMVFLYRKVIKPIGVMQIAVQRYTETKNSDDILTGLTPLLNKKDEYGNLSEDISGMAKSIDRYLEESEREATEKERFKSIMDMAQSIQKSQLPGDFPAFPDRKEFDLFASMDPAKEVGGDFYDFFLIDRERLCLVIGDVSDKGIPAALFMMVCKTLLQSVLKSGVSPAEAMMMVNRHLSENNPAKMFVTVWLAVVDLSTGEMTEVNAGHEKPVLRHSDGNYNMIKYPHDMAVAVWDENEYTEYRSTLQPGDRLFVYTDGIPEGTAVSGELFGAERMLKVLNETAEETPEEQIRRMKEAVDRFAEGAEQFDDMTMLSFVWYGNIK